MTTYYVACITKKPNHDDPHTAIQGYGISTSPAALATDKSTEYWTQSKMIEVLEKKQAVVKSYGKNIKTGEKEFAELEVITKKDGSKYVKSKNDDDKNDNLLNQRECGAGDVM
jgi:wyosine [tRNA(Phe)-imidazoG37] synthetase (radical SAM superfamily)